MIARSKSCPTDRFSDLLAERISADEVSELESHLSGCPHCQEELQRLAGDDKWWQETQVALCDPGAVPESAVGERDDHQTAWLRALLEPARRDGDWGRLGNCDITGMVGQGGMGVVLRGWDAELNRPVAIKLLLPHLASSGPARSRFLREAQAAAAVVHSSVIPIYAVKADGPLPYLVMPLVVGGNLQQRVDREGPLELEEVLRIGLQIAEGLVAAHRQGVVHRDIKPANILLEDGGRRVLISDFGLARVLDDATLTMSGMIAGTPQYMSPEQASGEIVDHATDIYSLGGVLYSIATGRPPVAGDSSHRVLRNIGTAPRTAVHEVNERMPLWFDRLVCHFMHADRAKRPSSANEAVQLLQACLAHVRTPARADLPKRVRGTVKRFVWPVGVFGAVALCGSLTWLAWLIGSEPRGPSPEEATTLTQRENDSIADVVVAARAVETNAPNTVPQWNAPELEQGLRQIEWELLRLRSEIDSVLSDSTTEAAKASTTFEELGTED